MLGRVLICAGVLLSGSVAFAEEDHLNATAQQYRDPFYYNQNNDRSDDASSFSEHCRSGWTGSGAYRRCGHGRRRGY